MGRKRLYPIETVIDGMKGEMSKSRHRCADSKYRHNVQCFFDILRGSVKEKSSKDTLLKSLLENIIVMENNISLLAGTPKLSEYKQAFLMLHELEENIWKKSRNPMSWWKKMQGVLEDVLDVEDISLNISSTILSHSLKNGITLKKRKARMSLPLSVKPNLRKLKNSNVDATLLKATKKCFSSKQVTKTSLKSRTHLTSSNTLKSLHYKGNGFMHNLEKDAIESSKRLKKYLHSQEYLLNNPQWNS